MNRTMLESLNAGLLKALGSSPDVLLLGEDILDPYGGAFKVTKGCSTTFPKQVITTPISEAGLAGLAAGLALRGQRPVVEVMFGDFITLMADQLINHISKFRWMYNNTVTLPLVIRTPMGGRRGYGPTHSQTLEKLFMGIPGLMMVAPNHILPDGSAEPGEQLAQLIQETSEPVLFIENKLQYLLPLLAQSKLADFIISEHFELGDESRLFPVRVLEITGAPSPVCTIAAYGYISDLCLEAAKKLAYDHEVFCRLVVPTKLTAFNSTTIEQSTSETGKLVVVEEGTLTMGWGAELVAHLAENLGSRLKQVARVGAKNTPVPAAATLERMTFPQVETIVNTVLRLTGKDG